MLVPEVPAPRRDRDPPGRRRARGACSSSAVVRHRRGADRRAAAPGRRPRRPALRRRDGDLRARPDLRRRRHLRHGRRGRRLRLRRRRPAGRLPAPVATHPAALYRNDEPDRRRAAVHARSRAPATDLTAVDRAPIRSTSTATASPTSRCCATAASTLLRGLGDCRFEPANEPWALRRRHARQRPAFSATWEGSATLPTLAFGNYVEPLPDGAWRCPDNEVVRPAASGSGYAPPTPLVARLLPALDALQRLGRIGPARPPDQQRPPLLRRAVGGEQLWRFEPGVPPRAYTARRRLGPAAAVGHGHRELRPDRRRLPGGLSHEPGREHAPDPRRGAVRARLPWHGAASSASTATRPFVGGDPLPSTAWHPEFEDVNNDGSMDLLVTKGNVNEVPDFAQKDPSNLFLGQPDGTFTEGAEAAGIVTLRPRAAGPRSPTSTSTGCSTSSWPTSGRPPGCGATSARGSARCRRRRWAAGSASGSTRPARTAMRSVPCIEIARRRPGRRRRELAVGGGHAGGQLGWIHLGLGSAPRTRTCGCPGRTARPGPWMPVPPNQFVDIDRGAPDAPRRGRRRRHERGRADDDGSPRSPTVEPAPTSACRASAPSSRRRCYAERVERAPGPDGRGRGYDRLVVYADREHSANALVPDRVRPALRGGDPGRRARPATRRSSSATSAGAWPAPRRCRCDRHPLPGPQPAEPAARPVAAARRDPRRRGHRPRQPRSASSAGRRTPDRATIEVPAYLVDDAPRARRAGRARRERRRPADRRRRTGCGSSTTSTSSRCSSGPRAQTSSGVRRLLEGLRPGPDASARRSRSSAGTGCRCRAT